MHLLTYPGMYRTAARKKQQRQIQSVRADRETELGESPASMATQGPDKVPEPTKMGKSQTQAEAEATAIVKASREAQRAPSKRVRGRLGAARTKVPP